MNLSERHLALVILAAGFLALLLVVALPPYLLHQYYVNEQAALEDKYRPMKRLALQKNTFEQSLKRLKQQQRGAKLALNSRSQVLAAAELQGIVRKLVDQQGGNLISTRTLAVTADQSAPYQPVAIKVEMRGTLQDVQNIFHAIEYGRPLLFLDQINLRLLRQRGKVSDNLTVRFNVTGWFS